MPERERRLSIGATPTQAQRPGVVAVELPVVVELLSADEQTATQRALAGVEQRVHRARRQAQNAATQVRIVDLVKDEVTRQETVKHLFDGLPSRSGASVDQVPDHDDHGIDTGGAHVEGVTADARVELEVHRVSAARVDFDVEVGEAPVAHGRQQSLNAPPHLGEGFGDHGHRITDEGGRVVLQEHPR